MNLVPALSLWLERARRDVQHAWRAIRRMPGLAAVVIVSLGVGIGVNTTIFSWVQALIYRPLPGVRDATSFHFVVARSNAGSFPGASWLEYRDLRERLRSFRDVLAFRTVPLTVGETGRSERAYGQLVSANYFSALGVTPALGRFLRPEEVAQPGGEPVIVISYGFWQTRLAGAPTVVGQTLRVNDRDLTIVGIAPDGFQGTVMGLQFDLWVPATLAPALLGGTRELEDRGQRGYSVMGKLQPGATFSGARTEMADAMRELALRYPETNASVEGDVLPFWGAPRGPQRMLVSGVAVLQGVMLLLLLAVCANTANLVLARASTRQREIGVRLALGAARWRIVSMVLTENLLLGVLGAALGAAIAVWGTKALRAVPMIGAFPIRFQTDIDLLGLAFAMLLGITSSLVIGAAPALQLARLDPQRALRSGSRNATRSRWRNALMGIEVALALVVLVVAGLFLRSFGETRGTDPGFRREGVMLAAYDFAGRSVDTSFSRQYARTLLERLRAIPGVEAAAIARSVPLDIHGLPLTGFTLEGRAQSTAARDEALSNVVTPGYFAAMGIPLRAGSDFVDLADASAPPQVIVNEEFVRRFLDGTQALGRRLERSGRTYTIAGVVRNSLYDSFGEPATPIIYFSYRDRPAAGGEIHLRTRVGTEATLAPVAQRIARELDATVSVYDVRTLSEHVEKNLFLKRIPARMFVVLGPLLLVLLAIGIYAVVAYTVARRTAEIGVRLALGATPGVVVAHIVRENLRPISNGALLGLLMALLINLHVARGVIYLPLFVGIPALLLLVAAIACWLPARAATRVDPMVALSSE